MSAAREWFGSKISTLGALDNFFTEDWSLWIALVGLRQRRPGLI
jgi:hypothetical protein